MKISSIDKINIAKNFDKSYHTNAIKNSSLISKPVYSPLSFGQTSVDSLNFGSKLYDTDKPKITDRNIDDDATEVRCHSITLNKTNLDKIIATTKNSKIFGSVAPSVVLNNDVHVGTILAQDIARNVHHHTKIYDDFSTIDPSDDYIEEVVTYGSVTFSNNSSAKVVRTNDLQLNDNSQIQDVDASKIISNDNTVIDNANVCYDTSLRDNSKIKNLTSHSVEMYGNSTVENVKAKSIEIKGNAKILNEIEIDDIKDLHIIANGENIPYINPLLIKTKGEYNYQNLKYYDESSDSTFKYDLPKVLIFKENSSLFGKKINSDINFDKDFILSQDSNVKNIYGGEKIVITDNAIAENIKANNVIMRDDSSATYVGPNDLNNKSNSVVLHNNAKANSVIAKELSLYGNSCISKAETNNVSIFGDSNIENLFSSADLMICSNMKSDTQGGIKNIKVSGRIIEIEGNVHAESVEFLNAGGLIVLRPNEKGELPTIDKSVNADFMIPAEETSAQITFLDNILHSKIDNLQKEINKDEVSQLPENYKSIEKIVLNNENVNKNLDYLNQNSDIQSYMQKSYEKFANNVISPFTNSSINSFIAKEIRIGSKKLPDLLQNITNTNSSEKSKINDIAAQNLIEFWSKNVLALNLQKDNFDDLNYLENKDSKLSQEIYNYIKNNDSESLKLYIDKNGTSSLKTISQGTSNLVDYWIELFDGKDYVERLDENTKEKRIIELLNNNDTKQKLFVETLKVADATNAKYSHINDSIEKIITGNMLTQNERELLQNYKNSQVFVDIISSKIENCFSPTLTKDAIISTIRNDVLTDSFKDRESFYKDIKSLDNLLKKRDNPNVQMTLNSFLNTLNSFAAINPDYKNYILEEVRNFDSALQNKDKDLLEKKWDNLIKIAQEYSYFDNKQSMIETNLISTLEIQKAIKNENRPVIKKALQNNNLSNEQKLFIIKYSNLSDNYIEKLLTQPVSDYADDINNILEYVNYNNIIFKDIIEEFDIKKGRNSQTLSNSFDNDFQDTNFIFEKYFQICKEEGIDINKLTNVEDGLIKERICNYWLDDILSNNINVMLKEKTKAYDNASQQREANNILKDKLDDFMKKYENQSNIMNKKIDDVFKELSEIYKNSDSIKKNMSALLIKNLKPDATFADFSEYLDNDTKKMYRNTVKSIDKRTEDYKNSIEYKIKKALKIVGFVSLAVEVMVPELLPFVLASAKITNFDLTQPGLLKDIVFSGEECPKILQKVLKPFCIGDSVIHSTRDFYFATSSFNVLSNLLGLKGGSNKIIKGISKDIR